MSKRDDVILELCKQVARLDKENRANVEQDNTNSELRQHKQRLQGEIDTLVRKLTEAMAQNKRISAASFADQQRVLELEQRLAELQQQKRDRRGRFARSDE